jgi:TolB protein
MRPINRTRRRAVVVAVAALVMLATAADAATPGHNGSIVFMRFAGAQEDDHTAQLFVRAPSGTERQVTHVSGGAFDPAWSPDGSRIVFERWDSRHRLPDQLYTVNADGSALHPVATGCSKATQCLADDVPAWSPDGTQIVFVRYLLPFVKVHGEDLPSAADLMLVPAAGGAPQVLRHFAGDPLPGHPAWSPDGKQLVLPLSTATQPTKQSVTLDALNVLDIASGSLRAITPLSLGASDPDWSPDGTRIVFSSEAGHSQFAYVVRPDGTGLHKIAHKARNHSNRKDDPRLVNGRTLRPRWSPDGRKIVFFSDSIPCGSRHINGCPRGPERLAVFVMNPDGTGAHRLTHGARAESSPGWAPAR